MNGIVKTYLPNKRYGFIKGDDGRDYYFHVNEFTDKSQISMICEESIISFDERATPKGYKAVKCSLINSSDILTFTVPDSIITSRSSVIHGWDIIEYGDWIVHGSSKHSPQAAKNDSIKKAAIIGANALVDFDYYKITGSEAGTGRGTHYFTIHNFRGRAAIVAKRHSNGRYTAADLQGLNKRAESLKEKYIKDANSNRKKRYIIYGAMVTLSFPFLFRAFLTSNSILASPIIFFLIIGAIIMKVGYFPDEYGSWLKRR